MLPEESGALAGGKLGAHSAHLVRARSLALLAVPVAVTALGAALRFDRLGAQSFWFDEIATWNLVHRSLGSMLLHGIPRRESTPPLYYLAAWGWVRVAGSSEAGLRSLSALLGTATIPVVHLVARRLAGSRAAVLASLLVAVSPILVWYSQEARSYALFAFLSALSLLFFVRLLDRYSGRDLTAWAAVAVLALGTHYFALFLLAVEAALLWRRLPRRPLLAALAPPALTCLLLAPLVYLQRDNAAGLAASSSLTSRLSRTAQWFAGGGLHSPALSALAGAAAALALALLAAAEPRRRRGGLLALTVAAATALLPIALALAGKDYVFFRNLIAVWVPLAIAVAVGLAGRRFSALGMAAAVVLLAVFAYADVAVLTRASLQRDDYRLLARKLPTAPRAVVVVYPGWDTIALRHYRPDLSTIATAGTARVREITVVGVASDFGAWPEPRRLALLIPRGFRRVGGFRLQHFLVRRYVAVRPVRLAVRRLLRLVRHPAGRRIPRLGVLVGRG